MLLTPEELTVLRAVVDCTAEPLRALCKCDQILRAVAMTTGSWTESAEDAVCNTGYEDPFIGQFYDILRGLVRKGFLTGAGDLSLPAGPRYTECGITDAGRSAIAD